MTQPWQDAPSWNKPCLRIGHGGAAALLPANTLPSLARALDLGVDMVEFDVRACRDDLVLLHDDSLSLPSGESLRVIDLTREELNARIPNPEQRLPSLSEALDLIRGRALINLDLKSSSVEAEVVRQVLAKGMGADVLYSSLEAESLRRIRQADRQAITGFSFPMDRGNASSKPALGPLVNLVLAWLRLTLPTRVLGMMANAQADALMLYHKVLSRAAVGTIQRAGGRVFAWTVDTPERMLVLRDMGVNGITSNHPEFFSVLDGTAVEGRQR